MRILSQDGLHEGIIDVPYEQVSIEQKENEIWCGYSSTMDRHCVGKCFAKYSTEAKARKAVEMLHEAYMVHFQYKTMTAEQRAFFINCTDEKEQEKIYGVFCFPADDEVEV